MAKLLDAEPHFVRWEQKYASDFSWLTKTPSACFCICDASFTNALQILFKLKIFTLIMWDFFNRRHFRCIKPNNEKRGGFFQPDLIKEQLKYTGVLETVKIRRQGYATRLPHNVFIDRWLCQLNSLFFLWQHIFDFSDACVQWCVCLLGTSSYTFRCRHTFNIPEVTVQRSWSEPVSRRRKLAKQK